MERLTPFFRNEKFRVSALAYLVLQQKQPTPSRIVLSKIYLGYIAMELGKEGFTDDEIDTALSVFAKLSQRPEVKAAIQRNYRRCSRTKDGALESNRVPFWGAKL